MLAAPEAKTTLGEQEKRFLSQKLFDVKSALKGISLWRALAPGATGASAGRCMLLCAAMKATCEHMANGFSEDKSCVPDKWRVSITLNWLTERGDVFKNKKIFLALVPAL